MCTSLLNQGQVTTGDDRPTAQFDRLTPINAQEIPLGVGLAEQAKRALVSRRERLRIAEGL